MSHRCEEQKNVTDFGFLQLRLGAFFNGTLLDVRTFGEHPQLRRGTINVGILENRDEDGDSKQRQMPDALHDNRHRNIGRIGDFVDVTKTIDVRHNLVRNENEFTLICMFMEFRPKA